MSDEELVQEQLDVIRTEFPQLKSKIDSIEKSYWTLLDKLEERVDKAEAVLAQMVPAFIELSSQVASILNFLSKTTPEEKTELLNLLTESHKQFLETLSQAVPKSQ